MTGETGSTASADRRTRLMKEINRLSDQVRALRQKSTPTGQEIQIRHVEELLRARWDELRTLRAGGVPAEQPIRRSRGRYG